MGFISREAAELEIAVSELVTNVLKFSGDGRMTIRAIDAPQPGIEIEVSDSGPGIPDIEQAMRDGYSTCPRSPADTTSPAVLGLGCGLGAVQRMTSTMKIENLEPTGLRVIIQKWNVTHVP